MTEPMSLKAVTRHAFTRELLESARSDRPAPGAAGRALRTVGVVVSAASAVKASAHGAGASGAAAGLGTSTLGSTAGVLLPFKWLGVGFFCGVVSLSGAAYLREPNAAPKRAPTTAPSTQRASGTAHRSLVPESGAAPPSAIPTLLHPDNGPAPRPSSVARALPGLGVDDTPPLPVSTVPTIASVAPSAPDAMAQLGALREIRLALIARAPQRALALLDAFDRRYASTLLREELIVLRVETLADLGRSAEATALGEAFLQSNPDSAYAQRIRSKLKPR